MTSFNNPAVLSSLPEAAPGRVWAYLIQENRSLQPTATDTAPPSNPAPAGEPVFPFLANPEQLEWSRTANYAKSGAALTSVQSLQYYNTEGRSLQINDLLLEVWFRRRTVRPLLEKLQALLVPDAQSQQLHPKVLSFVWGSQRFGPCVLTSLNWKETAWLSGEPASATVNLTLVEIPPTDDDPVTRIYREQPDAGGEKLDAPLTDRQREEASSEAKKWLNDNAGKLPQSLQERVRSSRYTLSTDAETGIVTLFDEKGTAIGPVGRWDGREWTVEDIQDFGTQK